MPGEAYSQKCCESLRPSSFAVRSNNDSRLTKLMDIYELKIISVLFQLKELFRAEFKTDAQSKEKSIC